MWKLINDEQSKPIKDKFPFKRSTAVNKCEKNKFKVPFCRTAVAILSKIWDNEISESVKNAPSSKCFVKRYQEHLFSQTNSHLYFYFKHFIIDQSTPDYSHSYVVLTKTSCNNNFCYTVPSLA